MSAVAKDRARMAWYVYAAPVGDSASGDEVATDLVADLLYVMRENGVEDVGRVLERALMHYTHETGQDVPA